MLAVRVVLRASEPKLMGDLEFVAQDAWHETPPRITADYEVRRLDHGYEVSEDGRPCTTEFYAGGAVLAVSDRIHRRVIAELDGGVLVQAVTGTVDGSRFMLVAESGCRLTTLAIGLLGHGIAVEGDALAVLRAGQATAVPRPFYVRADELGALPPGAGERMPSVAGVGASADTDSALLAFRPDEHGAEWRIASAPLELIAHVVTGVSRSRTSALPRHQVARLLASRRVATSAPTPAAAVAEIAAVAQRARCLRLEVADVPGAAEALRAARAVC